MTLFYVLINCVIGGIWGIFLPFSIDHLRIIETVIAVWSLHR